METTRQNIEFQKDLVSKNNFHISESKNRVPNAIQENGSLISLRKLNLHYGSKELRVEWRVLILGTDSVHMVSHLLCRYISRISSILAGIDITYN